MVDPNDALNACFTQGREHIWVGVASMNQPPQCCRNSDERDSRSAPFPFLP
jgi:hypothetical protein